MEFYQHNKEWVIPVAILLLGKIIDFFMPWIRSYSENKYLSYKERRIAILIDRYRMIRKFLQSPNPRFSDKMPPSMKSLFYLVIAYVLLALLFGYLFEMNVLANYLGSFLI
jgi:hypothetical protein